MRVCPSVGLSVFVCAPAAEPSWHSAETSWQKTERLLLNLHQRCPFIFLLKHLNKRRLFLKRRESYWCKDCSAFYSSALTEFCSFIFTNEFFVLSFIMRDWLWDMLVILSILVHGGCTAVNIL